MQQFFATSKYDKKSIYKNPEMQYHHFTNTFGYYHMIKAGNPSYPKKNLCTEAKEAWKLVKNKKKNEIDNKIREYLTTPIPIQSYVSHLFYETVSKNAAAQKKSLAIKKENVKKLVELEAIYGATSDLQLKNNILHRILDVNQIIEKETKKLEVVIYDSPGRPPLLFDYPDLHEHIYDCIEFGKAHSKRRHEIIKVRMISHLHLALEIKYNEYLSRTMLNNYLLPQNFSSIAARVHHHPALVAITNVSRSEKNEHTDKHYCLASVKAVGKTFQTMQTIHETVTLADHDFPIGAHQKLIPSVYLAIDSSDSNDTLCKGQLGIFVRPQYNISTSSNTHMADLIKLTNQESFTNIFKNNNQSAYNSVERAMCTLSGKLVGITLSIDTFGSHLDSQDKVINQELAKKNFCHTGETLCTLWSRDLIFSKNVMTQHEESAAFLAENDGFLLPVSKGQDEYYLNPVYILQYADILKLPAYNTHCPSISPEMHHRLCCTFCGKYFPMLKMITTHKNLNI
ncbi:19625_t:CDS:2 [Cetraspora pellucida]|uniref:19625_t:CDS:1 n=1 Tax=Cetraspora pellucida TaxID=1433469 RepID=A0A9N9IVG5_9GLOM|nr:19625_t:CDS:2 [Cetraspora pellucida]